MRIEHDLHDLLMCARTPHAHSRTAAAAARGMRHRRTAWATGVLYCSSTDRDGAGSIGWSHCTSLYSCQAAKRWRLERNRPLDSCSGAVGTSNSAPRRRTSGVTRRSSAWPTPRLPPAAGGTGGASTARSRMCLFTGRTAQVRSLARQSAFLSRRAAVPRAMLRRAAPIGAAQRIRAPSRLRPKP